MRELIPGAAAPDFQLQAADGVVHSFRQALARGDSLLVFFKSSCPTCQLSFPYFERLYRELKGDERIRFFGVSQDDAGETSRFVLEHGLSFPILIDPHPYPVSSAYGVEFVPTLFWVNRESIIDWSDFGFRKSTLKKIAGSIARVMQREPLIIVGENDGLPEFRPG